MKRIEFAQHARLEVREAERFYAGISVSLGRRFARAIEEATESIALAPTMWPMLTRNLRRYVVKRFPFVLLYRVDGDTVEIIAVAHQSRRPGYWFKRL